MKFTSYTSVLKFGFGQDQVCGCGPQTLFANCFEGFCRHVNVIYQVVKFVMLWSVYGDCKLLTLLNLIFRVFPILGSFQFWESDSLLVTRNYV